MAIGLFDLAKLLAYTTFALYFYGAQRLAESAGTVDSCAGGPASAGPPRLLSALTAQQLGDGALASSAVAAWDFQGRSGVLSAAAGANVTLSCLVASNVTIAPPSVGRSAAGAFLQPTALDLSSATGLAMSGVSLDTDCATVLAYQQHLCTSLAAAGSLTSEQGAVRFSRWRDGFTALDSVNLTCPLPSTAPQPPCRLVAVQTAQQLLEAFTVHAVAAAAAEANLTIVIAANISITNITWPIGSPVVVNGNVTVVGSSLLRRPVLDFNLLTDLWELTPDAVVQLQNLTCANLAPTYLSPGSLLSQFSMLSDRVWAFRRYGRQLHINGSTLVVPAAELSYTRYWITFVVSPVPEAQAQAAWLSVIDTKIEAVNASGVYYYAVHSFTTTYDHVGLTDTLGPEYPLLPVPTGLRQLQADAVPLTAVNRAAGATDLLLALLPNNSKPDDQGRRWVLLTRNFSIGDGDAWPGSGGSISNSTSGSEASAVQAAVPAVTVFERFSLRTALRLGLGGRVGTLSVPSGAGLLLRGLLLDELGTRGSAYDRGDPLAVLASPLWGVALAAGASKTRLENCTVLVSADELRLLQQALMAAGPPAGPAYDGVLVAAVRTFFSAGTLQLSPTNANDSVSSLTVVSGATQRYALSNVLFRTPVTADGETARVNLTALGVPYEHGGGQSGLEGWEVGVIVGCVVGGVLLLALAGLVVVRRRWMLQKQRSDGGQSAYEKYLRSTADPEGHHPPAGGPGSEPQLPSRELTNSSQVLRLGACNSNEVGAEASLLKKGSPRASTLVSGAGGTSVATITGEEGSPCGAPSTASCLGAVPTAHTTAAGFAAAAAAAAAGTGAVQMTDSFDHPPSTTTLRQHGPIGGGRGSSVSAGGPSSGQRVQSQVGTGGSATPTGGAGGSGQLRSCVGASAGGGALEQMHQMIQSFGRDFNDKQLAVQGVLGKGAHGTVYKGTWRGLTVAVKSMIFGPESTARHQHRPLMEAAISSNLAHANIVTTYSYELREVQHELASLSPELAQQGGGWRLLIIQEFCDAGPLRRLVDCGFFLTPPKPPPAPARAKPKRPTAAGLMFVRQSSSAAQTAEASIGGCSSAAATGSTPPAGHVNRSRASSTGNSVQGNGNGGRASPSLAIDVAGASLSAQGTAGGLAAGQEPQGEHRTPRPALDDVPVDVPGRPGSSLQAALRYVEAALMIARGLQHIHDKNIVHGDLNPNNVLLVRTPHTPLGFCLKVSDFGLSIKVAEGESHMSNLFQGTPYYCAPEVVLSGKVGKSADLYSLGIMLWELQNGMRPPWRTGVRLRTYPSINTGELEFGPDTPPRYVRLARDCFRGSSSSRPCIAAVVATLEALLVELNALTP